jgi:hypothetical protein
MFSDEERCHSWLRREWHCFARLRGSVNAMARKKMRGFFPFALLWVRMTAD